MDAIFNRFPTRVLGAMTAPTPSYLRPSRSGSMSRTLLSVTACTSLAKVMPDMGRSSVLAFVREADGVCRRARRG